MCVHACMHTYIYTYTYTQTWGNRLSGLVLGPLVGTAGWGAWIDEFSACLVMGDLATSGTSACSGMS